MKHALRQVSEWTHPWYQLALACLGAIAIIGGWVDGERTTAWGGICIGVVWCLTVWRLSQSVKEVSNNRPYDALEGAMLAVVSFWMCIRLSGQFAGQLLLVGALGLGWYQATKPRKTATIAHMTAITLELGLWIVGAHSIGEFIVNVAVLTGAVYFISKFASMQAFRDDLDERRQQNVKRAEDKQLARDFGLLTEQAPVLEDLPRVGDHFPTVGRATLDFLTESFDIQLRLLRQNLNLTTAVILWRGDDGLVVRGCSSIRMLEKGPYPEGVGLPGSAIRNQHSIALAPAHETFAGLPYYPKPGGVGSAYAMVIRNEDPGRTKDHVLGVLCVDRELKGAWTTNEKAVLEMVARKVSLDVSTGQRLKATDHERSTVAHLCAALQELNAALGMEEVAHAVVKAVRFVVAADLVVVATVEQSTARIIYADGPLEARYSNKSFDVRHTLVGQAVSVGHALPARGDYTGQSPIFFAEDILSEMRSALIIPLQISTEDPIGVLMLAAEVQGAFVSPAQEMLQLIAGQVAVKLDLSNAHEQIREMAMVDGMTGLKNHRTFQQAFDTMLERASRKRDALCLILMDIDRFKQLNDTYGHPFGDEVLKRVARILGSAARKVDLAARYGGEEFTLILEDSDEDGGRQIAERIRREIELLRIPNEEHGEVAVTISMGIASYPRDGDDKDELITHADQALYLAKQTGRNRVCDWSEVVEASDKVVSRIG